MNKKSTYKYLLFLISVFLLLSFAAPVFGEESGEAAAISAGDTSWVLTASALVLLMTIPGLALFYGGMVRNKNVLSTMMHSFIAVCGEYCLGALGIYDCLWFRYQWNNRKF